MSCLDQLKRVQAPDFFYTRLQAKMEADMLGRTSRFFCVGNLRLSMALMALVLIMNFLSLLMIDFNGGGQNSGDLNTLSKEYFAPTDDYNYLSNP